MTNFKVKVHADKEGMGSNRIEVSLDTCPKTFLSFPGREHGMALENDREGLLDEDIALYYAVERIAQLESLLKEWQERTGVPIDLVGDYKRIVMQETTNANG